MQSGIDLNTISLYNFMSVMFFIAAVTLAEGSLKVLVALTMDAFVTGSARNVEAGSSSSKNAVSSTAGVPNLFCCSYPFVRSENS